MNNKEVVKKIKEEFNQTYYFVDVLSADCTIDSLVADCTIDSLVRIDEEIYDCDKCILADIVNTVRIMCPLIMKRETRILK